MAVEAAARSRLLPLVGAISRWRYALLALWLAYLMSRWIGYSAGDWHFFVTGGDLLLGRNKPGAPLGGIHLFANYPELQMGPLGFVVAWIFRLLSSGDGGALAQVAMCALALPMICVVERAAARLRNLARPSDDPLLTFGTLAGGFIFVIAWVDLAGTWSHLADVLLLAAAAAGAWALAHQKPIVLGIAIGAAVAAKPWGIFLFPLALALPGCLRVRALAAAGALSAFAWLPFIFGDTRTFAAMGSVAFANDTESGLRALGVHDFSAPHWVRPTQLGLGIVVATVAVVRRRWPAALLGAIAVRMALDPRTLTYYLAGLLLATLIWDLVGSRLPVPLWTLFAYFLMTNFHSFFIAPHERGLARVAIVGTLATAALVLPRAPKGQAAITSYPHWGIAPAAGAKS